MESRAQGCAKNDINKPEKSAEQWQANFIGWAIEHDYFRGDDNKNGAPGPDEYRLVVDLTMVCDGLRP